MSVHGVLSRGVWQKDLSILLSAEGIPYDPVDFGFLLPTVVLSQRSALKCASKVAEHCTTLQDKFHQPPSIIAHSYGTLVVAKMLANYHWIHLNTIVFSGSIVPCDFDWITLVQQHRVRCIINFVAAKDSTIRLAACVGAVGQSGIQGFRQRHEMLFQPLSPDFGHPDWFAGTHFGRVLVPILERIS
jgi:serine/threonine-protein kinase